MRCLHSVHAIVIFTLIMAPPDYRNLPFSRPANQPKERSSLFRGALVCGALHQDAQSVPCVATAMKNRTKKRPSERYSYYSISDPKGQAFFARKNAIFCLFPKKLWLRRQRGLYLVPAGDSGRNFFIFFCKSCTQTCNFFVFGALWVKG